MDVTAAAPSRVAITDGGFEIDSVEVAPDGASFYLQSTEAHPGERQIYRVAASGGARERLTTKTGAHQAALSPDQQRLGLISSSANRPPEVFIMENRKGAEATAVTSSATAEWRSFKWVEPELVTYKARDGATVYARLFTPEMVGAKRHPSQPAVIFVHGAGYLQNAHRYWSSYYREYMFHHLLASRGYVVLDPDYRASAGYGRDWRTAIYGWMGGHDLNDVVDGAGFLASAHRVDPKRVGVYGGSYGGFITLMAMFTSPDTFAAGAALRPVTDWAHYNHPYTANILDEPPVVDRDLSQELADLLRGGAEGRPADLSRDGGRQRPLPGLGSAGTTPDRARQGELGARRVSRRGPWLRRGVELGGRIQADPEVVRDQSQAVGLEEKAEGKRQKRCKRKCVVGGSWSGWTGRLRPGRSKRRPAP